VSGTDTRHGSSLSYELELVLSLALELPDTVRAEVTDVEVTVLSIAAKRTSVRIQTRVLFTCTDLAFDTLMRMASLLSLAVGSPRLAVRAMRLELEDGRDRADLGGHIGHQGLDGRSGSSDDPGRGVDRDKDGRATHVLWVRKVILGVSAGRQVQIRMRTNVGSNQAGSVLQGVDCGGYIRLSKR
jgi:hypothetical protein